MHQSYSGSSPTSMPAKKAVGALSPRIRNKTPTARRTIGRPGTLPGLNYLPTNKEYVTVIVAVISRLAGLIGGSATFPPLVAAESMLL